jgi:chemotaxis response regulator CheB
LYFSIIRRRIGTPPSHFRETKNTIKTTSCSAVAKSAKGASKKALYEQPQPLAFPILGVGASAGGLEAMELFLKEVPVESGMAYVLVQHLDPNHKGMLCELLQRITPLPVQQILDRTMLKPNNVYVIPPGFDLSILHGVLYLLEPTEPHGQHLPIDYFLRSLAEDQKNITSELFSREWGRMAH